MLSPNYLYPHISQKVISDVTYFVEKQILYDWAISIEYTDNIEYLNTRWNRWGDIFYKITNSSDVIDNIFSCHINNPVSAIRLHAEKFSPVTRFDWLIGRADHNEKNSGAKLSSITNKYVG